MYMEHVILPTPPEGYEYKLVPVKPKRVTMKNMEPSELTPRQLATLKYREKNREKILEYSRQYRKQKQINLSKEETSETTKSE